MSELGDYCVSKLSALIEWDHGFCDFYEKYSTLKAVISEMNTVKRNVDFAAGCFHS